MSTQACVLRVACGGTGTRDTGCQVLLTPLSNRVLIGNDKASL